MQNKKWQQYLFSCNYPPSITRSSVDLCKEAREFTQRATRDFDNTGRLLVLGCGDGYELDFLKRIGWKDVTGITLLKEEVGDRSDIVQGDVHELPFKDEEFDYVISKETLEHFIAPPIALMEINRVMKTGGRFVHYIPTGVKKQRDWYHYGCFPDWVWVDLMYKAGFEVQRVSEGIKQLRYEGYKAKEPNWMTELYNLEEYVKRIRD